MYAILIAWPKEITAAILEDILQFDQYLKQECLDTTLWETVPAYNSLTLANRNTPIVFEEMKKQLTSWYTVKKTFQKPSRFLWRIPVCYDEKYGIDLEELATTLKLTKDKIVALHTDQKYTVYGIGFLPGFMYLGGVPKELEVARRSMPRLKVEKGAVGLAARQTGIYPQESPGGWNIIGNCPIPLFNASKSTPCFVAVGDEIQFYSISSAEYDLRKIEADLGIFKLEKEEIHA